MPKSIMPHWIVSAQLTIDLMKTTAEVLGEDVFASSARDVLIFLAVMIGHAQRRPMTALNISEYISVPRATVVRRLDELCERKILRKLNGGKWCLDLEDGRLRALMARAFGANLSHIHNSKYTLSKMDS